MPSTYTILRRDPAIGDETRIAIFRYRRSPLRRLMKGPLSTLIPHLGITQYFVGIHMVCVILVQAYSCWVVR